MTFKGKTPYGQQKAEKVKKAKKAKFSPIGFRPPKPKPEQRMWNHFCSFSVVNVALLRRLLYFFRKSYPDFLLETQQFWYGCCEKVNIFKCGINIDHLGGGRCSVDVGLIKSDSWTFAHMKKHFVPTNNELVVFQSRGVEDHHLHHDGGERQVEGDADVVAALHGWGGCWDRDEASEGEGAGGGRWYGCLPCGGRGDQPAGGWSDEECGRYEENSKTHNQRTLTSRKRQVSTTLIFDTPLRKDIFLHSAILGIKQGTATWWTPTKNLGGVYRNWSRRSRRSWSPWRRRGSTAARSLNTPTVKNSLNGYFRLWTK